MKKEKFVKNTMILIISGFITKILGMVIRIISTRIVGEEGIGLFMLIMPTMILFITLCQLGIPTAINILVAEGKKSHKKLLLSIFPITIILNIILVTLLISVAPFLAETLLHSKDATMPLMAISIVIPLVSLSSMLRGYYFGRQRMIPPAVSHLLEQISRIIFIMSVVPPLMLKGVAHAIVGLIIGTALSEVVAIIIFFLYLPKKVSITKKDLKPDKSYIKNIFDIGLPTTGSKLIGSITYFFEPILITFAMMAGGFSNQFIITEYGILNGFAFPLLLLSSFFTLAISNSLIPTLSHSYNNGNIEKTKKTLRKGVLFSLVTSGFFVVIISIFPKEILKLVFNTTKGANYVRTLVPIFFVYYFQAPLVSALQAFGKAKEAMIHTLEGSIIKLILIFLLARTTLGMYGLVIAISANIIYITYKQYRLINKTLNKKTSLE